MPNARHSLGQLTGASALFLAGQITNTGGAITCTILSPPNAFDGDVTVTDNNVGDYSLAISNFRGPVGVAIPLATVTLATTGVCPSVQVRANSYSGDTLTLQFQTKITSTGLSNDASINFMVLAY